MTKRISNKMLISLMVAMMLICVLSTCIYAAEETVYIKDGEGPKLSEKITTSNGANYQGWNYRTSGHRLYICLQSSDGSGWSTIKKSLMDIDSQASGTSTLSGLRFWRVQLNPQYAYTDCYGKGVVSSR